jgi:predicted nucleic acid-binding Zn ribbon protein
VSREDEARYESRPRLRRRARENDAGPVALAELMVPALARLGLRARARQVQLTLAWPGVVGEVVAAQTAIVGFTSGRLVVESSSPALSHQLRLQSSDIVAGLNQAVGERVVRSLFLKLATAPGEKPA